MVRVHSISFSFPNPKHPSMSIPAAPIFLSGVAKWWVGLDTIYQRTPARWTVEGRPLRSRIDRSLRPTFTLFPLTRGYGALSVTSRRRSPQPRSCLVLRWHSPEMHRRTFPPFNTRKFLLFCDYDLPALTPPAAIPKSAVPRVCEIMLLQTIPLNAAGISSPSRW